MQYMTDQYHTSMAQPIRNRSHIRAEIYKSGGDSISFTEDKIISFSRNDYVSPISETLPTSDMTLTIDNRGMEYDPDNEDSPIVQLTKGLEMMVQLGYEIDGDGVITWIPAFYGFLSDWDATDTEAMFTAQDMLQNCSVEYPLSYPYRVGLYQEMDELVDDMAQYVNIGSQVFYYTAGEIVWNALPAVPVSEGFQIVANASGSILSINRNGNIIIGGVVASGATTTASDATVYSSGSYLMEEEMPDSNRFMYATQSNGGAILSKNCKFAPASPADILNGSGSTSDDVAGAGGTFGNNLIITMETWEKHDITEFGVQFLGKPPLSFIVSSYDRTDTLIETVTINNPSAYQVVSGNFGVPWYINLEFTDAEEGAAVTVSVLSLDPVSDFTITRQMMLESPKAKRQEKVKSISVAETTWTVDSGAASEVYHKEVAMSAGETRTFIDVWGVPIDDYSCTFNITGTGVSWTGSYGTYGYQAEVSATVDTTATFSCTAKQMNSAVTNTTTTFNSNGIDITWDNPLNNGRYTDKIEDLLEQHYLGTVEYEINWRGDPCVDVNDKVWLELKDGSKVPIRIYQNTLNYNGVLSGVVRARRVVDF